MIMLCHFFSDYNSDGQAIRRIWSNHRQTATNRESNFYDDAHPLIGDNFSISETDEYNQEVLRPQAAKADGGFVVAWLRGSQDNGYQLQAQFFGDDFAKIGDIQVLHQWPTRRTFT